MGTKTGRKTLASKQVRQRALSIKKSNPGMTHAQIAARLNGVTPRMVQYWLSKEKKES